MSESAPIVGTKCCGTCRNAHGEEMLSCAKRPASDPQLWVDYFYLCPLWRARQAGRYL